MSQQQSAQAPDAGPPVVCDVEDGVATVRLSRPVAMNSLDVATKTLLRDTLQSLADDAAVRCVVLTGSGRAFCVGQDLKEHVALLRSEEPDADEQLFTTVEEHYNPIVTAVLTMPKPVLAAVNGVAAGAGASLALACDRRVLAESAGMNLAFAGVALSCDTGISWTLPRLVGREKALDLLYFPRTIGARECVELGLAAEVVPDDELMSRVGELARRLATGPTVAYGAMRRAVAHSAGADLAGSLAFEGSMMTLTGRTDDHRAAVDAFLAKERPAYEGR